MAGPTEGNGNFQRDAHGSVRMVPKGSLDYAGQSVSMNDFRIETSPGLGQPLPPKLSPQEKLDVAQFNLQTQPTISVLDTPPTMTPEQFAYWVKGIAEGRSHPIDLLGRILEAARKVR